MKAQRLIEFSRIEEGDKSLTEQFNLMMEQCEQMEGFKVLQVNFGLSKSKDDVFEVLIVLYEFDFKLDHSKSIYDEPNYMKTLQHDA